MKKRVIGFTVVACMMLFAGTALAFTADDIPGSYKNITVNEAGELIVALPDGTVYPMKDETPKYSLRMARGNPVGTEEGFAFDFTDAMHGLTLEGGTLFYALCDLSEKFPIPKWKREAEIDESGQSHAKLIGRLQGKYDFIDWEKNQRGCFYYRVADATGYIIYEGKFWFTGNGPFTVDPGSIIEGPFLNMLTHNSVVISFETMAPAAGMVTVNGQTFYDEGSTTHHEIAVTGLSPNTAYDYTVSTDIGQHTESYALRTAPAPGTRAPFTFAFTSDSRSGISSGEREIAGTNAYMMKKIMALVAARGAKFMQFTGDEIDGYRNAPDRQRLEYTNWKRSILPWASRVPVVAAMGNHEALMRVFDDGSYYGLQVDRFPYATESAEALFAEAFVNPSNGPESEDGAAYDPDPNAVDFPSYKENVFYYTYDNIAMICLNSNYWYAPSLPYSETAGGNPHGYLMDNQIAWLQGILDMLDADENIDYVFVTHHTPVWPNGGHIKDDMFYTGNGSNDVKPVIKGADPAGIKGIIERRDEYWTQLMNSSKVVAVLTGDEHNYARLLVQNGMPLYGEKEGDYVPPEGEQMQITRAIWQVHNGAAGAPYYGLERTPWNNDFDQASQTGTYLKHFTTENAVVFFHVNGKSLKLEVVNPDTLDRIE